MNNKTREPGFYWIKLDGEWLVGRCCDFDSYAGPEWSIPGYGCPMLDFQLDEIDEERIVRKVTNEG